MVEDSPATTGDVAPTVWEQATANQDTTVRPQPENVTSSLRAPVCTMRTAPTSTDVTVENAAPPAPTTATVGTSTIARTASALLPPLKLAPKTPTVEVD